MLLTPQCLQSFAKNVFCCVGCTTQIHSLCAAQQHAEQFAHRVHYMIEDVEKWRGRRTENGRMAHRIVPINGPYPINRFLSLRFIYSLTHSPTDHKQSRVMACYDGPQHGVACASVRQLSACVAPVGFHKTHVGAPQIEYHPVALYG